MLELDGRHGEGGGQILRTALSLSMITGQPFHLSAIRADRPRPGLAAQHLTAVRAAAVLADAEVRGDGLRSIDLTFRPSRRSTPGSYTFDVGESVRGGTAGSVSLLFQTLLPPLALAAGRTQLVLRGGTHVAWSPSFDYVADVWLPLLGRIGIRAQVVLNSWGWFPAGGGEIVCTIEGTGGTALRPVELVERGALRRVSGRAVVANLPEHICERMASRARALLSDLGVPVEIQPLHVQATGAGAGIFLVSEYEQVRAGFGSLGKRGRPAEQVAEDAIAALREHDRSGAAVDVYLADQALLPLALADAPSQFTTPTVSGHLGTNAWVIEQFGVAAVEFDRPGQGRTLVTVRPMPIERRYTATPPHLDGTSNA